MIPDGFKTSKHSNPLPTLPKLNQNPKFALKSNKPNHKTSSMAEHGGNEGGREVVDQPEDRGGMMEHETGDQAVGEAVGVTDAVAMSGGDSEQEQQQEVGDDEDYRASKVEPRATKHATTAGSISEPVGTNTEARASPVVGGSSGDTENSGTIGDETGPNGSPPRDSAKGKGVVIEEENVEEVTGGAATSSRHVPITYDDIAEHAPDEILARVLEQHPEIGEYVLKDKEDRAKAIEAAEAAARAEREAEGERAGSEGLAADIEAKERDAEEAQGPRVSAVAEAGALKRPEFSEETYMLLRPHLFVPLGFAGYRPPQQTDYDPELILRDPGVHIPNTWAEVYLFLLFT
ncbi:hypothetical protein RHMOL_Rhmol07G0198800 [Rhododendron molle]|uniref:Uncharacterized protein n=1 Tax=Rhododendron molle TaxID=49168 RepID=A0ACC0N3M7_RHOML|nr:hypothetical protein RHMOL_Rhmol07G0198800 [Rhododendron molle]